jgi:CRISPR-associated endonuclease/helicase Cas3
MTYREFFEALTGFPPFCYQERIAELLLARESVILRVPTGAGKTWASVAPFAYSLAMAKPIADRLLYALPLRSLAGSLHADVLSHMQASMLNVRATGKDRQYGKNTLHCSLQTGAQKDDPFFESELVFTTIDQLLSSYVGA